MELSAGVDGLMCPVQNSWHISAALCYKLAQASTSFQFLRWSFITKGTYCSIGILQL